MERETLRGQLEARIRELEETLRRERANMEGSAKEREEQLRREIED